MAEGKPAFDGRTALALVIALFSILGITVVSLTYILVSDTTERSDAASQVFNGILPLYGTWVGTLLAFYFAKENFDSATKNTVALSQISAPISNNLESILVSSVISLNFLSFNEETDREKRLEEVKKLLTDRDRGRLPILKRDRSLKFLVYYRDIDEFILSKDENQRENQTLENFIAYINGELGTKKKKEVVYVAKDISLAKAEQERKSKSNCLDIIVTETGKEDSAVIGYLTEIDIDKFSRSRLS